MKKYMALCFCAGAMAASAFASAENYCMTPEVRKMLNGTEAAFIKKQLKGTDVNVKALKPVYSVKETRDSMGGPEFTCAGRVTVKSAASQAPVLSYDIKYGLFIDEGFVGMDDKISRTNISR